MGRAKTYQHFLTGGQAVAGVTASGVHKEANRKRLPSDFSGSKCETLESSPQMKLSPDRSSPQRHAPAVDHIFVEEEDYWAKQTFNFEEMISKPRMMLFDLYGGQTSQEISFQHSPIMLWSF